MADLVQSVRSALGADAKVRKDVRLSALTLVPDGALVMEGLAESLAAKKRALALAGGAGAAGIVDRICVNPGVAATDAEIRVAMRELFGQDPSFADLALLEDLDPSPLSERPVPIAAVPEARGTIEIEVRDGLVTLNGAVPSLARKRLAGAMAWRAPGVRDVINGLAVEPPEEDGPDALEEAVRLVLECDRLIDAGQIRVGVRGDVVRLTGLVRTPDASRIAEAAAWSVLGVEDVKNEIEVRP